MMRAILHIASIAAQTTLNIYKPVQTTLNIYKPVETTLNIYKPVETTLNIYKPVENQMFQTSDVNSISVSFLPIATPF